jgi:hypothetical protein
VFGKGLAYRMKFISSAAEKILIAVFALFIIINLRFFIIIKPVLDEQTANHLVIIIE